MLFLFDDSCQMDGGQHYLFAHWAWTHPQLFVSVWSRPLFTLIYALPALAGFRAARALTVLICLAIAWQTWRLAEDLKMSRAPLSIALLFLQPSFFLFCADTMTEPIFALVYVIALRLHHSGKVKAGMVVASLLILARPEGFFLGVLWAFWGLGIAGDQVSSRSSGPAYQILHRFESATRIQPFWPQSAMGLLLLATGSFVWWLAALLLTGDPLFIKHNWPDSWPMTGTVYGAHGLLAYPGRLPEVVGPVLLPAFVYGLIWLVKRRRLFTLTSSFLLFFLLHTVLRAYGLLGSAGYPRYLVAISPAIALITLAGWNEMANWFAHVSRPVRAGCAAVILATSAWCNFVYADGAEWSRDARAINVLYHQLQTQWTIPPIAKLVLSKPYTCILFNCDPWENPSFTRNHDVDLQTLRNLPAGTLAVWDARAGPKESGLQAEDFQTTGFSLLYAQSFNLKGYILDRAWFGFGGPRQQTIYVLYKF
jgi:hypothetical protein